MDSLDTETEDVRNLTRSALGPLVGESSSDQDDRDVLPSRNFSRSSYVIDDNVDGDDLDDEITAVFNEDPEDCTMSKSWHGSRSSSQRSLAFFVDLNSSEAGAVPPLNRSNSHSQSQRRVSSARARTRAGSCSTSFFVDLKEEGGPGNVRSTSRLENCEQLSQISDDISNKSKELLAKNLQQSQVFFTKLKAFIDFLNLPNYSKAEVRHKKVLADKITRVMFEEEQRLRRGLNLSELKNLDSILNVKNIRPNSAYATMQNTEKTPNKSQENAQSGKSTSSANSDSGEKPILRREKTFDLEHSSILSKELKLMKKQNRKSMPVNLTIPIIDSDENEEKVRNGWMIEDSQKSQEDEKIEQWPVSGEINLLKYFQQQRLEHTRLLRKEITRLEKLEKVYLSAIKKNNTGKVLEKKPKSMETDKHKKVLLKISETNNFNRNETFTKSDRRRVSEKISKTNFREVADRKKKNDNCSSILPPSDPNSPMSWYIPSEPSSRSGSNNSQREEGRPAAQSSQASQVNLRARASSVSNKQSFGWNGQQAGQQAKSKTKHFGQMYPSRQHSQDSDLPASQCRGIQTGRSLLRMYLRKADKGQQVCDRPQAFFLPLDQTNPDKTDLIDLETSAEKDLTDLQGALRKNRPDYIAAAEERAGRVLRGTDDKKSGETVMTRSSDHSQKAHRPLATSQIKRSQSSPRVNSILKPSPHSSVPSGVSSTSSNKNGVKKKPEKGGEKKTVTIVQTSEHKKTRNNVAVIKSRTSMANQQHYNIKNIYAPESVNNLKNKVY